MRFRGWLGHWRALVTGANEEKPAPSPREPAEARLLGRLRLLAGAVILVLIAFLAFVDALGRLLIDPTFHVGDVMVGTLVGALLLLLGIETIIRIPGIGK